MIQKTEDLFVNNMRGGTVILNWNYRAYLISVPLLLSELFVHEFKLTAFISSDYVSPSIARAIVQAAIRAVIRACVP
jgi:hypothetical protein